VTKRRSSIPKLSLPSWGKALNTKVQYSGWWTTIRQRQLTAVPKCERCGALATEVHHRIPVSQGGPRYLFSNLESICGPCHRAHHGHRPDNH
jgi:5-methylcytosine-specific restriction endonuclease McrA